MEKRGRPRHPDILTPREWEVLALLRESLTNEEIGERLGISERTAKYHVAEIMGKLGMASREEAARWRPDEHPRATLITAPIALFWRKAIGLTPWKAGAIGASLAAGVSIVAISCLAFLGVILVRQTMADGDFTVEMEGRAMEDTIPNGALLSVDRSDSRTPQRRDIVVFLPPDPAAQAGPRYFVKRVIGLPGDMISVHDRSVWVNGERLDEPYVKQLAAYEYGPKFVPSGHVFVLGDNRNDSSDSHSWGMLPERNIVGRVVSFSLAPATPTP